MQTVLFDPGYSDCILGVSDNVEFMYGAFVQSGIPLKQKKFQFSILFPKLKKMLLQNVAFYLGCLLWAVYLKSIKDGVFEDNPCLDCDFDEENAYNETNFLIDFVEEKLNKDSKYYINTPYQTDERLVKVLKTYNEFLKLNQGFRSVKTTADIFLPENIKNPDDNELKIIKNKIDEALKLKDLTKLFDVYEIILGWAMQKKKKKFVIDIKNMGINIDKNEYREIVLSNSSHPEIIKQNKKGGGSISK